MFQNFLGGAIYGDESNNKNKNGGELSTTEGMAAAATNLFKQATETIANNMENPPQMAVAQMLEDIPFLSNTITSVPSPRNNPVVPFPLVNDDAGLLLASSSEAVMNVASSESENPPTEEDEDELAAKTLVQFPSYGTQSYAMNKDTSSQWQEKTADWLLGGTSSIPTPQQQLEQKQQEEQALHQNESLPIIDENGDAIEENGQNNNNDGDNMLPKLVNSREWSVDEQLLWKTPDSPSPKIGKNNKTTNSNNTNNTQQQQQFVPFGQPTMRNGKKTFTTRNGEVLTLKEHEVDFEKPVLEDPMRDYMAAYYYHVGIMPNMVETIMEDYPEAAELGNHHNEQKESNDEALLSSQQQQQQQPMDIIDHRSRIKQRRKLQGLIKQHSSPYHVNKDIQKDLSNFGGLSALPDISEEKVNDEPMMDHRYKTPSKPTTRRNSVTPLEQQQLTVQNNSSSTTKQQQQPSSSFDDDDKKNGAITTKISEVAWMPDRLCKTCYSCDTPFTVFRRRHHCRICGQIFCNACSSCFVPASQTPVTVQQQLISSPKKLLYKAILPSMTPNGNSSINNASLPMNPSHNTNQNNSQNQQGGIGSNTTLRTCKMCYELITAKQQEQQKKQKATAADDAAAEKAKKSDHTQASSNNDPAADPTAVASTPERLPPPMIHEGFTSRVKDFKPPNADAIGFEESSAFLKQWSKAIGTEGITSLATKAAGLVDGALSAPPKLSSTKQRQTSHASSTANSMSSESKERCRIVEEGNRHMGETASDHLEQMTTSLLESDAPLLWNEICVGEEASIDSASLGQKNDQEDVKEMRTKWVNKLMSLATRVCATVDTNIKRGDMLDIRPYVKIKVIPGGSCDECTYMSGVVFRKTGTNKQMPQEIINPRIMLLSGGIEFTRTNRMASLDTLLEQEDKYIEILVGKILKLEPDLLIVGKGVSRRAQELLQKNNVQLLQQVKASLLNRISRQTGATIISNQDHIMNQFGAHVLGKCHRFRFIVARDNESWINGDAPKPNPTQGKHYIQSLLHNPRLSMSERQAALAANMLGENILDGSKAIQSGLAKRGVTQTFAVLEGCPKHLGCTIILRGADKAALKQIKNVFRFIVGAAYNMKLEMSYLEERCVRLRPDYRVQPKNLYSCSFCVDYGSPPNNRKIRPWNGGTNNDGIQRSISGHVTAFDHQSILITSVWMTNKTQCCPAEVKGICYYSMQDVSLGQFLRDSCFNLSLKCQNPSCKKSVLDHSLSFVHNDGLINITVDRMDKSLPQAPAEYSRNVDYKHADDDSEDHEDNPIATWTYCHVCNEVVTPLTWLSTNTWKYSFGKFLESSFYNRDTIVNSTQSCCSCSVQRSTTLFFGCGDLAAKFTYERIRPFGVSVRKSLPIDTFFHRSRALQHLEKISMTSSTLFVKFDKHIEKVVREARSVKRLSDNHNLQTVILELSRISNEVDHAAKTLQEKIASVSEKCTNDNEGSVNDAALFRFPWHARRFLFMLTSSWNEKLSAAGQAIVAMKKLSAASHRNESGIAANVPSIVTGDNAEELNEGMRRLRQLHEVYSRYNLTDIQTVLPTLPGNTDNRALETEFDDDFEDPDAAIDFAVEVDADVLASRRRLYNNPQSNDTSRLGVRALTSANSQIKQTPGATVKSAITRFFQRGGRDKDPYVVSLGMFHDGRPRLEPGVNGIVVPVIDEQLSTVIAYSLSSKEYDNQFQNYSKIDNNSPDTTSGLGVPPSGPQQNQPAANMTGKKGIERRMLMRNKSHIKHTFRDLDEKGQNLCKFICHTYWATQFHAVREAFLSQGSGSKDTTNSSSGSKSDLDIEKAFILSLSSAYSWAASGGKSGASFARTADDRFVIKCISRTELQMFLDCAPAYFEYLSKAFFHGLPTVLCKIVGVYQIGYHNRVTGKRSMEQVAVMQNIFYNKKITKIFDLKGSLRGRFASQMKNYQGQNTANTVSGYSSDAANRQRKHSADRANDSNKSGDDGDLSNDYDHDDTMDTTKQSKKEGPEAPRTLLDGDFLETTLGRPMPMHDRAKEIFHMSILNDTLFLSIINVLDYSILVGIDEEKMELVVGIIDFMRQYDILKQMERVGKSIPMVVGSEAPTIIQPPLYKARFTNAMERYFMTVPSKWTTI